MEKNETNDNINEKNEFNEINEKMESLQITDIKNCRSIIRINQITKIDPKNKKRTISICKLKIETNSEIILGFGFLLKFYKEQECFYCLVSDGNVIKKGVINNNIEISMYFNNELKTINLKDKKRNRYIKNLSDYGLDLTIIEILDEDNISKDYFLWDENEIDNNRLISSHIYIPEYIEGKELVIIKINKYEFTFISNIKHELTGIPIFLENSYTILGIYKGANKEKTENYAYLIYPVINIITNYNKKRRNN